MTTFQLYVNDVKKMKASCDENKYTQVLGDDLAKFLPKLCRAVKMIEAIHLEKKKEGTDREGLDKLMTLLNKLSSQYSEFMNTGKQFGIVEQPKKGGRANKKKVPC